MADWQKLVRKHQSDVLEPGEELVATLLAAPDGAIKAAAIAGGVGGVLGSAGTSAGMRTGGAKAMAAQVATQDGETFAGTFPVTYVLLSITNQRFLVFQRASATLKKPEQLIAAYPRDVLVGAATKKGFMNRKLTLSFSDGSALVLDGGMAQPFDKFEQAASAA
ncbi:MAG: hypothetical protein HKN91_03015 [Acidimicrobiia bacterium]|nr:hypothetical protein [Acidimicrobiia bacterium]